MGDGRWGMGDRIPSHSHLLTPVPKPLNIMLDLPLTAVPLAFLDFETTGLSPRRGDRVCEVALQRVVGGVVVVSYTTLVDPQRPLSERSFAINQISAEQWADAPT